MYKLAISRPITTLMFALAIMFFGILGIKKLSIALFPNVDFPLIMISTTYPGASPEVVESKVTDKIEEAVMGIDGVKSVTSNSARNISLVMVEFQLTKDLQAAMTDVVGKVSSVSFDDSNIKQPSISKFDTNSQAIVSLFVTSKTKSRTELMMHSDLVIKPLLQKISGVGGVQLSGYRDRQIRVYADPTLMNKYNITYASLFTTLGAHNLEMDGGKIQSDIKDFSIIMDANGRTVEEIANIRVGNNVKLGQVAVVEDGLEEETTYASYNKEPGVIFQVMKVSGANEVDIADGVYAALNQIKAASPGYDIRVYLDATEYIRDSLKDVEFDLVLGGILAVLIVFFFLRSVSITLVAAISLPVSILGTFAMVQIMGYTLNMLTMMALTLAIGIIIDDAIVVIENIHKKLEMGMSKKEAAYEGVREISFAIIAISAMLLSVFIPIGNMSGIIGKFFASFGITVVFAVVISYIVVITVIPMVSSIIVNPGESKFYHLTEPFFEGLQRFYNALLNFVLRFKIIFAVLIFVIFGISLYLAGQLGSAFMLSEDKSKFNVYIEAKPGISIIDMKKRAEELRAEVAKRDDVKFTALEVGYGQMESVFKARMYVALKPISERKNSQFETMRDVQKYLQSLPEAKGLSIYSSEIADLGAGDNTPFQMRVYATSQSIVDSSVAKLKNVLETNPTLKGKLTNYHTSVSDIQPEYRIRILRQNAEKYGVTPQAIGSALSAAFSGSTDAAYFKENGKEYSITMRVPDSSRGSVEDIKRLRVQNSDGKMMFLDGLIDIQESSSPSLINRYARQRSVTVYVSPALDSGISLGDIVNTVTDPEVLKTWLDDGASYALAGQTENMAETMTSFSVAVVVAFILIYMILAALYESILEPLIIMVTMPLSFSGAFFAMYMAGQPLSMFAFMGLILLIGLVGKNATLLIDIANEHRRETGCSVYEAIKFAGNARLRPILMTTIAMVFGMLPLAIATGTGYAMKSPIGISMIGGLCLSMILSLLIVPIFYVFIAPIDDKIKRLYQGKKEEIKTKRVAKKAKAKGKA